MSLPRSLYLSVWLAAVGCGVGDGGVYNPEDEALEASEAGALGEAGEVHYLPNALELEDGVAELAAAKPFRSFGSQLTAAADAPLEYQVRGEDGTWSEWATFEAEWADEGYRSGHTRLGVTATHLRVRAAEGVEFARFELFEDDEPTVHDDDEADAIASEDSTVEQEISRPGAWSPTPAAHAAGQKQSLRYENAARCDTNLKPGTRALGDFLRKTFPGARSYQGFNCRKIRGGAGLSVHGTGRALDIFVPLHKGAADNDLGDPIANFLIANANRIGISLVIWDRSIWGAHKTGNKLRAYTGQHPHHDHLHIELNTPGATKQTAFFREGLSAQLPDAAPAGCTVQGLIAARYNKLGGPRGPMGRCKTSELPTPDGVGRFNHFEGGSIYFHPSTGAFEVRGAIRDHWASLGYERSGLGYPTGGDLKNPDGIGFRTHFQGGSIYWSPKTGAQNVRGAILDKWHALSREHGPLGYPTTSDARTADGIGFFVHFQGGSIFWSPATGAHDVRGAILAAWAATGYERGPLGYPTSGDTRTAEGFVTQFQKGSIVWTPAGGAKLVLK